MELSAGDPQRALASAAENEIWGRSGVTARFYKEAVYDKEASEGYFDFRYNPITGGQERIRVPGKGHRVYKDVEFVEIRRVGDIGNIVTREAREIDKQRFSEEYARFQKGVEDTAVGTPIEQAPFLSKGQALEFQAAGVRTVEELAQVTDSDGQKFMDFTRMRQRARDFVAAIEGNKPLATMRAELESRDDEIATLKVQMAELLAAKAEQKAAEPPKAKRGRPAKVKPEPAPQAE